MDNKVLNITPEALYLRHVYDSTSFKLSTRIWPIMAFKDISIKMSLKHAQELIKIADRISLRLEEEDDV